MTRIEHPLYQKDLCDTAEYIQKKWEINRRIKILIIGATGLIGSFLVDALLYYNHHVRYQFDIYAMGRSILRLKRRFSYAESSIHLWEHDINWPLKTDEDFDYIFHLASNADPGKYALYPFETITTNILGSVNVINYAKEHLNSKILFTSSMESYGENDGRNLCETDYGRINHNNIRSGYPESKRISELLYRSAVKEYGIAVYIARLGYIYGPTMIDDDNKVVAEFIRAAVNKKDILLKSEGTQRRTYCYVADAVCGMLMLMVSGIVGEVYNIADKKSLITIRQLGEIISEKFGVRLIMKYEIDAKKKTIDKTDMILNMDKIEKLGWKAKTEIAEGINKTVRILREEE